jgi:hypothetical protein
MSRIAAKTSRVARGPEPVTSPDGFKVGNRVSHPKFGNGIVKAINSEKLTIQFARNVVKEIFDSYVKRR